MNNPALSRAITATAAFLGVTHGARGDVTVAATRNPTTFRDGVEGRTRQVNNGLGFLITIPVFGPVANLSPLYQFYQRATYGQKLGPTPLRVESINTGTEVLTITGHGLTTADPVRVGWDETAPSLSSGSLSRVTTYYARSASSSTITLHPTANDATNNTNALNFTNDVSAGSGRDLTVYSQRTLVVHRETGYKQTFLNVVPVGLPDIVFAPGQLFFEGNLVFRAFPSLGSVPSDGNAAFYSSTSAAFSPSAFDGAAVLTDPATAAWGGSAPWDAFQCQNGFRVSFAPQLTDVGNGVWGAGAVQLTDFQVTARGIPVGITIAELQALFTESQGAILDGSDLVITGLNAATLTLYQAIVSPAGPIHGPSTLPIPELTWTAGGDGATARKAPFALA